MTMRRLTLKLLKVIKSLADSQLRITDIRDSIDPCFHSTQDPALASSFTHHQSQVIPHCACERRLRIFCVFLLLLVHI